MFRVADDQMLNLGNWMNQNFPIKLCPPSIGLASEALCILLLVERFRLLVPNPWKR